MSDDKERLVELGEPEETIRQRLRADADAQNIAKSLGVDIEDYITQVLFYARRPDVAPQVEVLDDESLAELGAEIPSEGEVQAWLDAVERGEVDLKGPATGMSEQTEFTTATEASDRIRAAMGERRERVAPTLGAQPDRASPPPGQGSILEQQLLNQQRQARLNVEARRRAPDPKKKSD